jgi:glycosyltransferase involved in cell wall biosynthesis
MIRVLQFADVVNRYDFIDNIVQRADRTRFDVGVCVRTGVCNIEAPAYVPEIPRWTLKGTARREIPRAAGQLASLLRRWKADILHTHHFDQAVIGWLATRIYRRSRLVIGRHYSDSIYRSTTGLKRRTLLTVEHLVNRAASRIIVPSTFIREILTCWQGVDPAKVDLVRYGFVPEKYAPPHADEVQRVRGELGLEGRFVLGNFARLHEEKGQRFLIRAMDDLHAHFPRIVLLIVGEGPERKALEKQIRDANLGDAVRILGWRRDAIKVMAAVDAVVQPTLQEAFSQVMSEALWMGKPLIITDVSGATDIIKDSHNGLLVPKGDSHALTEAIERLVRDDGLRKKLVANGNDYVNQDMKLENTIRQYENAYERSLSGNFRHE